MIDINFSKHLTRVLPYHKRQTNRLKLFYWPFIALQELFNEFIDWRRDVYYRANITGQVLSLQSLLNYKVKDSNSSILVKSYEDQGIWVQLSTEVGDAYKVSASLNVSSLEVWGSWSKGVETDYYVSLDDEASYYSLSVIGEESVFSPVAMEGEVLYSSEIDFYIYVPQVVNIYEVEMWVNSYKIAGKRYQIIQA